MCWGAWAEEEIPREDFPDVPILFTYAPYSIVPLPSQVRNPAINCQAREGSGCLPKWLPRPKSHTSLGTFIKHDRNWYLILLLNLKNVFYNSTWHTLEEVTTRKKKKRQKSCPAHHDRLFSQTVSQVKLIFFPKTATKWKPHAEPPRHDVFGIIYLLINT